MKEALCLMEVMAASWNRHQRAWLTAIPALPLTALGWEVHGPRSVDKEPCIANRAGFLAHAWLTGSSSLVSTRGAQWFYCFILLSLYSIETVARAQNPQKFYVCKNQQIHWTCANVKVFCLVGNFKFKCF